MSLVINDLYRSEDLNKAEMGQIAGGFFDLHIHLGKSGVMEKTSQDRLQDRIAYSPDAAVQPDTPEAMTTPFLLPTRTF